jgi:phage terminase large subunit
MIFEPPSLDWFKKPNFTEVFQRRAEVLAEIEAQEDPEVLIRIKSYYRDHPAEFISDWGCTVDPRNPEIGLPALLPFVLYPKQVECINWILERWRNREPGMIAKSRTVGMSWLTIGLACTLCMFNRGLSIGFGSYREKYVDEKGEPKALLVKGRYFMANLPAIFQDGWNEDNDAPSMRMFFRSTESQIGGQVGDDIGRGDRRSLYFVDESAHLLHPQLVDSALADTTNCRIDFSSVNGMANTFAERWHSGRIKTFVFHWRDDPRRDDAWYIKKCEENDPVVIAQEFDINFQASQKGILIQSDWISAAIGAHEKLGFQPSGQALGALDVADEGKDLNAFVGGKGVMLSTLEEWTGKGDDIYGTTQRAFMLCDAHGYKVLRYDGDGLGAGVRGDARIINSTRNVNPIRVEAFRGSGEVVDPEKKSPGTDRTNKDFFANAKAQAWWSLRKRFMDTYYAVTGKTPEGAAYAGRQIDRDSIISIDPKLALLSKLQVELTQPTYTLNNSGKVVINKQPDGTRSPNLADAVNIKFAPMKPAMHISNKALQIIGARY